MTLLSHILPMMMLTPLMAMSHSRKHFLMCLLNLEAMTLAILISTSLLLFSFSHLSVLNILIILSLAACEASLGLACLVKMMHSHGNDNLKMLNMKYL